uniref:RNA polymerase Rpb1 domain-containing protein n=1 Tax=Ditylenchus dipsaci TaxID=166011 RepID=A0A915EP63_9BILA
MMKIPDHTTVAEKIHAAFGEDLKVVFADDNAEKLVFHLRLSSQAGKDSEEQIDKMEDDVFLRCIETNLLSDLTLQDVDSISKVYMHKPITEDKSMFVSLRMEALKWLPSGSWNRWYRSVGGTFVRFIIVIILLTNVIRC